VCVDISDRKKSEARQDMLLHELQHRVKNILATVASLGSRLKQTSGSVEDYATAWIGRLRAMAQTQELLSPRGNDGVRIRDLIAAATTPQQTGREDVIRMSGPDLSIPPDIRLRSA
jgi:two-component system CheB/CheR fusion protein